MEAEKAKEGGRGKMRGAAGSGSERLGKMTVSRRDGSERKAEEGKATAEEGQQWAADRFHSR